MKLFVIIAAALLALVALGVWVLSGALGENARLAGWIALAVVIIAVGGGAGRGGPMGGDGGCDGDGFGGDGGSC